MVYGQGVVKLCKVRRSQVPATLGRRVRAWRRCIPRLAGGKGRGLYELRETEIANIYIGGEKNVATVAKYRWARNCLTYSVP